MTTYALMRKLYRQIDDLNSEIDAKIVKGLSYRSLARRHRLLMEELHSIEPQPTISKGIINKIAQYVSVFLL